MPIQADSWFNKMEMKDIILYAMEVKPDMNFFYRNVTISETKKSRST